MPITSNQIIFRNSTGGLGGNPTTILTGALSELFPNVEASPGSQTTYRCIYIVNTNTTIDLINPRMFLPASDFGNTLSADTTFYVGLGSVDVGFVETAITGSQNPETELGISFSAPTDYVSGVALGDTTLGAILPKNSYQAIWLKRVVNGNAAPLAADKVTLSVRGETTA